MQAFRFKNLVYIPITKCASTSYSTLFGKQLEWESIPSHTINWDTDHVFAHIIHPHSRHLKGTATAVENYGLWNLLDHPQFSQLFATAVFDIHSYPLATTFGIERMYKIDWLLLDHPEIDGGTITKKFLEHQGININKEDIPVLNQSSDQRIVNKLRSIRDSSNVNTLTYFYENDGTVYTQVLERFRYTDLDTHTWDQCSWLNKNV